MRWARGVSLGWVGWGGGGVTVVVRGDRVVVHRQRVGAAPADRAAVILAAVGAALQLGAVDRPADLAAVHDRQPGGAGDVEAGRRRRRRQHRPVRLVPCGLACGEGEGRRARGCASAGRVVAPRKRGGRRRRWRREAAAAGGGGGRRHTGDRSGGREQHQRDGRRPPPHHQPCWERQGSRLYDSNPYSLYNRDRQRATAIATLHGDRNGALLPGAGPPLPLLTCDRPVAARVTPSETLNTSSNEQGARSLDDIAGQPDWPINLFLRRKKSETQCCRKNKKHCILISNIANIPRHVLGPYFLNDHK